MNRWDEFRYINCFDAIKFVKNNENLFKTDVLDHWRSRKKGVKKLLREYR